MNTGSQFTNRWFILLIGISCGIGVYHTWTSLTTNLQETLNGQSNNHNHQINVLDYELKKVSHGQDLYPCVIIGSGNAGLTAGIYLAQAGYQPLILEGSTPGGALSKSHEVNNWPGSISIPGGQLMDNMREQAANCGCLITQEVVQSVDFSNWPRLLTTKNILTGKTRTIRALSVIIATGATPNFLGIPGEQEFWGQGVTNCAVCDGNLVKGGTAVVIGGGSSALTEALYLANLANKVYILVRSDKMRAHQQLQDQIQRSKNIEVVFNAKASQISKNSKSGLLQILVTKTDNPQPWNLETDGLFLAIGSQPNSKLFANYINTDKQGLIELVYDQATTLPGVFAAGDVVDGQYRQAIVSAGQGCQAALQNIEFLHNIDAWPELCAKMQNLVPEDPTLESKTNKPKADKDWQPILTEINNDNELQTALDVNDGRLIMLDFSATWCMPCKLLARMLDENIQALAQKIRVYKINIDKFSNATKQYQVRGVPTLVFLSKDGKKELTRQVGLLQMDELEALIEDTWQKA